MDKAPDLHIINLDLALRQFCDEPAKGEVGLRAILQPVTMCALKHTHLVPADLAGSSRA